MSWRSTWIKSFLISLSHRILTTSSRSLNWQSRTMQQKTPKNMLRASASNKLQVRSGWRVLSLTFPHQSSWMWIWNSLLRTLKLESSAKNKRLEKGKKSRLREKENDKKSSSSCWSWTWNFDRGNCRWLINEKVWGKSLMIIRYKCNKSARLTHKTTVRNS